MVNRINKYCQAAMVEAETDDVSKLRSIITDLTTLLDDTISISRAQHQELSRITKLLSLSTANEKYRQPDKAHFESAEFLGGLHTFLEKKAER